MIDEFEQGGLTLEHDDIVGQIEETRQRRTLSTNLVKMLPPMVKWILGAASLIKRQSVRPG